jgi:hypothetical protein
MNCKKQKKEITKMITNCHETTKSKIKHQETYKTIKRQ